MAREKTYFDRVINSIERVRKPGEPPQESLHSFDEFECDLCKGFMARKEFIQCHYCGRWVCKSDCWNEEHLSCTSCASVIKLGKELALSEDLEHQEEEEDEGTETDGEKGILKKTGGKLKENLQGLGRREA